MSSHKIRICLGLLNLFLILKTTVTAQTTLVITSDQSFDLYINGVQRTLQNNADTALVDHVDLSVDDRLIAIHARGNGWCSGVTGSTADNRIETGYRFRCTAQFYSGWMNLGFQDYSWPIAHTVGNNDGTGGLCPDWPLFEEISPSADWIWTANRSNSEQDLDTEVYCRGYMPVCESSPCVNGATCSPNGINSICICPPGYTGTFCETHLIQDCGDLLHLVSTEELQVPPGWHHYCFLSTNDTNFLDFQCRQLIRGLPGYPDSEALIKAGGNFGCWLAHDYPNDYLLGACVENYQHHRSLASCLNCRFMGVCIKLP